jgi:dienelactone hydrolase
MKRELRNPLAVALFSLALLVSIVSVVSRASQDPSDERAFALKDPDHFRWAPPEPFPTREAWERRSRLLRQKLLLSSGLWPERERTPLNARIFDLKSGDGFNVAKVYFESLPGFLATGNIYYPVNGKPPYPAVLTPHGHWEFGRLQNGETGSIPGRCIDFARQGYVVFSIDMVGYNDSFQLPHDGAKSRAQLVADSPLPYEPRLFRSDFLFPEAELYGFNLSGLQLWNAIRALDFLTSLPEVDPARIGVTGASGGATQTILVMAADDRVRVAAPVNIIGAAKHPGCGCENPPGLWIDTSTIELAATFAPRPLLLVSATEDPWTNSTPTRELPMLRKYYRLFGAEDKIDNRHVSAGHNYNAESRAAVYTFFRKYLHPPGPPVATPAPIAPEPKTLGDLRVFPDHILPPSAKPGRVVVQEWQKSSEETLARLFPKDAAALAQFRITFVQALALVLDVEKPRTDTLTRLTGADEARGPRILRREQIGRRGRGDRVEIESLRTSAQPEGAILLVAPESYGPLLFEGGTGPALPWVRAALAKNLVVFRVRGYASGRLRIPDRTWYSCNWPESYNRSNEILAIQDTITAMASIRQSLPDKPLTVVGLEKAGLPATFAAAIHGEAARVIIDLNGEDPGYDATLRRLLPAGSIRRIGDLRTAVLLLLSGQVHLLNPGLGFESGWYREEAARVGASARLLMHESVTPMDPALLLNQGQAP